MLDPNFVFAAAILNMLGSFSYIVAMRKGKARPNRVSWIIWTIAPLTVFAAQLSKGVGVESLLTLSAGVGPLLVLIVSFTDKQAYWKINRLDWICGGLALAALVFWAITREGLIAIILAIVADALACIPTLIKSYTHPESEHPGAYIAAAVAAVITLLTIPQWTLANASFSIYVAVVCVLIVATILSRKSRVAVS